MRQKRLIKTRILCAAAGRLLQRPMDGRFCLPRLSVEFSQCNTNRGNPTNTQVFSS
ncbi:MAG: hypothetical protein LBK25_06435 [Treponema sp.]|nr:hypothetical protein [Treponema sp.]